MSERWFCFNGEYFSRFATEDEARQAAEDSLKFYREDASNDGEWNDNASEICYGPVTHAVKVDCVLAELDHLVSRGITYLCEYNLVPVDNQSDPT